MAKKRVLAIGGITVVAAIGIIVAGRLGQHRLELKSCFEDVQGLKSGAPVRLAGVDVGTVRSVRAEPQNKNCPAEVEMILSTSYELPVPRDALTSVETAGIPGNSLVIIDPSAASGPPVEEYGYLNSKPTKRLLSLDETLTAARALLELEAAQTASKQASKGRVPAPTNRPKP
jgi:phospholipid/cholesterol/gamma-HCH transport system substrate-binding protein